MKKTSKHNSEPLATALNNLSGRYVLPSFQRDYVWKMNQIENLFNSIYRGYPFGTMLFWRINSDMTEKVCTQETFYRFLFHYHEENSNKALNKISLLPHVDYWVVLDGQQRLTSLNIGLLGSYYLRARYQRKDDPNYPEYKMYMLISEEVENPFKFLKTDDTHNGEFYEDVNTGQRWMLVRAIFYAEKARDLAKTFYLTDKEEDRVSDFKDALNNLNIEFSEMTGFDYSEATNVFVKVNSGGTVLEMADILNSIIVTTWNNVNAKEQFKDLIETVSNSGFFINTNFIVKAILYLHHSDVRFQIQGFTDFILQKEKCWDNIKSAIIETFRLLKSYGLSHATLGGYNVTLPILYYIYHRDIKNPSTAAAFSADKQIIKNWLLSAILMKLFSGSSDSTLRSARAAFTERTTKEECELQQLQPLYSISATDSVYLPMKKGITKFPINDIKVNLADGWYISDETIVKLLTETQKGERYSLPILSLLYPDFDLNAVEYEQDHLHPMARIENLPNNFKNNKENKRLYNSILNLQLLQKTPNIQKADKKLEEWVAEMTQGMNDKEKKDFLDAHLIPNVNLDEDHIASFFESRKNLLLAKLKEALKL